MCFLCVAVVVVPVVVVVAVCFAAQLKRVFRKGFTCVRLCVSASVCVCKLWLWIDYQVNMSPLD